MFFTTLDDWAWSALSQHNQIFNPNERAERFLLSPNRLPGHCLDFTSQAGRNRADGI
jgi:hypothetical protein